MSIQKITVDKLRRMSDQEGLIIQGCGGDLQDWVDGINEMLTQEGILKKGAKFGDVYSFRHGGLTCLLFPFKNDVSLDGKKLAIWRVQTRQIFGSTWLSDYVPNELGGFLPKEPEQRQKKPDCPLIGCDGNIFAIMGKASRTLRENGMRDQAKEMCDRIMQCSSYGSALSIIGDYVNITEDTQSMESEDWDMEMY